jgi:hypothetical protein
MSYTDRFTLVEDYLRHLDTMMAGIADPFVQGQYLGFIATSAVTAYELAIKDIFYAFAEKKHVVLGEVTRARFRRLNGQIGLKKLRDEHVQMFGDKYVTKFTKVLDLNESSYVLTNGKSPKGAYGNIITWRNVFVHEGTPPNTTNYQEMKDQYLAGKEVINSLNTAMYR